MNVLQLTDSDSFAGTEQHILTLSRHLQRHLNVRVGCPHPSPLAQRCEPLGIPTIDVPRSGPSTITAIRKVRQVLREGVDLVHAHNGRSALVAAAACRAEGRRSLVFTQHFIRPAYESRTGFRRIISNLQHSWVNRQVSRTIAISGAVRDGILMRGESDPSCLSLVHNGIDIDRNIGTSCFQPVGQRPVRLLCAARLHPEKAVNLLIRAIARVDPSLLLSCEIAGAGPLLEPLRVLVRELRVSERVRLLGFRTDIDQLMKDADMFVLPAPDEPFGLVLLEAMAASLPVIAASAGGPVEIVGDRETGLLFRPGDEVSLAKAVEQLAVDEQLRSRLGKAGRKRVEQQFSAHDMAVKTLAVYRLALGHVAPGAHMSASEGSEIIPPSQ